MSIKTIMQVSLRYSYGGLYWAPLRVAVPWYGSPNLIQPTAQSLGPLTVVNPNQGEPQWVFTLKPPIALRLQNIINSFAVAPAYLNQLHNNFLSDQRLMWSRRPDQLLPVR